MLKFFKIAKSSYYYTIKRLSTVDPDSAIKQEILAIYKENKARYGYRRITLALRRKGYIINHKKVSRLMKLIGIKGITPRAKYKSYKGNVGRICGNLLLDKVVDEKKHTTKYIQNFKTTKLNEKWTTDVSEFHIASGKLYLSPILDMNNREIISYNISKSPNYKQIENMLKIAFQKYPKLDGLIFHSDQGWQYQLEKYRVKLSSHGIIQSMSRKGNCLDNGLMENFFGVMKREMFYGKEYTFNSLKELEVSMKKYIEYYNKSRITVKLKGLSPYEYRHQSSSVLVLN